MKTIHFLHIFFLLLVSCGVQAQIHVRHPGEKSEDFIYRISGGKYLKESLVQASWNTAGDKILYFYYAFHSRLTDGGRSDSVKTIRLCLLQQDTLQPFQYHVTDLELDTDRGYGLGIESAELVKTKKEKFIAITVFHLLPGPGRVRYKGYERFTLKQRSNNAGFFNEFELTRIR